MCIFYWKFSPSPLGRKSLFSLEFTYLSKIGWKVTKRMKKRTLWYYIMYLYYLIQTYLSCFFYVLTILIMYLYCVMNICQFISCILFFIHTHTRTLCLLLYTGVYFSLKIICLSLFENHFFRKKLYIFVGRTAIF